jgi:hypothetical protein
MIIPKKIKIITQTRIIVFTTIWNWREKNGKVGSAKKCKSLNLNFKTKKEEFTTYNSSLKAVQVIKHKGLKIQWAFS